MTTPITIPAAAAALTAGERNRAAVLALDVVRTNPADLRARIQTLEATIDLELGKDKPRRACLRGWATALEAAKEALHSSHAYRAALAAPTPVAMLARVFYGELTQKKAPIRLH